MVEFIGIQVENTNSLIFFTGFARSYDLPESGEGLGRWELARGGVEGCFLRVSDIKSVYPK